MYPLGSSVYVGQRRFSPNNQYSQGGWLGGTKFFQCSIFCHPMPLKLPLKMRKLQGAKVRIVMLDAPVFWILFSCISEKLMPRAKADFTKNNGFKAFYGFRQGNTLIQPQYTEDSRLFRAKQGGYPNPMPTSVSGLPSLSPVTHRDALYAGFKPLLGRYTMKQVFWLVEPMGSRGISPQISQYD